MLEIELLSRAAEGTAVSEVEAAASDSRQALVGGLYLIAFVVTGILFLRWTYLASRNARALGATDMEFTPGWTVGWYFVPVANLWKPYQALKEIFAVSHPASAHDRRRAPRPGVLPLWWTLWILATFVGQVLFRTAMSAETIDQLLTTSWLTFASDALDIPLGLAVIVLVSRLQTWQEARHRRVLATS